MWVVTSVNGHWTISNVSVTRVNGHWTINDVGVPCVNGYWTIKLMVMVVPRANGHCDKRCWW